MYEYLTNPLFIEYNKEYNKAFEYIDFYETEYSLPLTLEKKDDVLKLNCYGREIQITEYILNNNLIKKKIYKYLEQLIHKYKIKKCYAKLHLNENILLEKKLNNKIFNEMYIDLSDSENTIFKNFRLSHRTRLNKIYEDLNYQIINHENYNNEILEMKKMHIEISGRQTRSDKTWLINENMIKNDNGFLIKVNNKDNCLSYLFFFYDNTTTIYFSSASYRQYYKIYKNLGHRSMWEAIKYSKKKSKIFLLGEYNISNSLSDPKKNINSFKKGFCGFTKKVLLIENCNELLNYLKI